MRAIEHEFVWKVQKKILGTLKTSYTAFKPQYRDLIDHVRELYFNTLYALEHMEEKDDIDDEHTRTVSSIVFLSYLLNSSVSNEEHKQIRLMISECHEHLQEVLNELRDVKEELIEVNEELRRIKQARSLK
jgi:hypothetical protein